MSDYKMSVNVVLRSNITAQGDAWTLVPGDIVEQWKPNHLVVGAIDATLLQREEKGYYVLCAYCKRHVSRIKVDGPVEDCKHYRCSEITRRNR